MANNLDPNFFQKWWPQLSMTALVVYESIRSHLSIARINKMLFDRNDQLRLMTLDQCDKCRQTCLSDRREFREHYREDIQNLQRKIDDMPQKIADLLASKNNRINS